MVDLARGLEVAGDGRLLAVGDAVQGDGRRRRGKRARVRHGAAEGVVLPVERGLAVAHRDLLGRLAGGVFHAEGAGHDIAGRHQRRRGPALLVPDHAELAALPGDAGAAAAGDQGQHLGMGDRAVEHEVAAEALRLAPGAPGDQGLVVDPAGREPDAGDQADAEADSAIAG